LTVAEKVDAGSVQHDRIAIRAKASTTRPSSLSLRSGYAGHASPWKLWLAAAARLRQGFGVAAFAASRMMDRGWLAKP
jgi:hypothetical protein